MKQALFSLINYIAHLRTTAIYADAVGAEEHQIMEKMWGTAAV